MDWQGFGIQSTDGKYSRRDQQVEQSGELVCILISKISLSVRLSHVGERKIGCWNTTN